MLWGDALVFWFFDAKVGLTDLSAHDPFASWSKQGHALLFIINFYCYSSLSEITPKVCLVQYRNTERSGRDCHKRSCYIHRSPESHKEGPILVRRQREKGTRVFSVFLHEAGVSRLRVTSLGSSRGLCIPVPSLAVWCLQTANESPMRVSLGSGLGVRWITYERCAHWQVICYIQELAAMGLMRTSKCTRIKEKCLARGCSSFGRVLA